MDRQNTVTVNAGNVEYSPEDAAVTIEDALSLLEAAKSEGATHIVFLSGNYRGAQYLRVSSQYNWLEDGDE